MWGVIILFTCMSALPGKLSPDLSQKIKSATEEQVFHVFIFPEDQPDYAHLKRDFGDNKKGIADYLRSFAHRTQREILTYLNSKEDISDLRSYWVANVIEAKLSKETLLELVRRDDVAYIEEVPVVRLYGASGQKMAKALSRDLEWNIQRVRADSVWALGYTGEHVIVGTMDSGVDPDHPALEGKWAGHWKDFVQGQPEPYDDNGHGTHVMGIILGGDGSGPLPDDIGVAPQAQYVAVKVFDSQGWGVNIMGGFNWFASLIADSGVNVRVINNSWGSDCYTCLAFWDAILTWRNLGIIPVFAVGSGGPASGSAGTPGNYPTVIAVGATDIQNSIASFSSRGPAPDMDPWNDPQYWPRPDWNLIKPDISAPGVSIRSSVPGGGYESWDGTSMAAPHVSGVIALLLSKNPFVDFDRIYTALQIAAFQPAQGDTYPNNAYGWGIVDALGAIERISLPDRPVLFFVGFSVQPGDQNTLQPDDTADIYVNITNISPVSAVNTVGTLSSGSEFVEILNGTASFGDIEWGDTVSNETPFRVSVDENAPPGSTVEFTIQLLSDGGSDSFDFTFRIPVGVEMQDYLDITAGNALLTVTDIGAIGFMSSEQLQGNGFVYPIDSVNYLDYGTFAVATSPDHVVDAWYGDLIDDRDWRPTQNPDGRLYYLPDPPRYADVAAVCTFDDSGHPDPMGITVRQLAYAYNDPRFADFIILEYWIKNEGTSIIDNLYAALLLYITIPGFYDKNSSIVDTIYNTAYNWLYNQYGGVALLYPDEPANLSVLDMSYFFSSDPETAKFMFMDGTYHFITFGTPGYYGVVASAGPFFMVPGDSQKVAFAVVGGTNRPAYLTHVARADSVYHDSSLVLVKEDRKSENRNHLRIHANVSRNQVTISFSLPRSEKIKLNIYDVTGRKIKEMVNSKLSPGEYEFHWDITDDNGRAVGSGIYFAQIRSNSFKSTEKLLILR